MAKRPDLVAKCAALPGRRRSWLDLITPAQLEELKRLREAWHDRRIACTMTRVRKTVQAEFGLTIEKNSFAEWMADGRPNGQA